MPRGERKLKQSGVEAKMRDDAASASRRCVSQSGPAPAESRWTSRWRVTIRRCLPAGGAGGVAAAHAQGHRQRDLQRCRCSARRSRCARTPLVPPRWVSRRKRWPTQCAWPPTATIRPRCPNSTCRSARSRSACAWIRRCAATSMPSRSCESRAAAATWTWARWPRS